MSADQGSNTETIYIPLLNEGVPVVRPTQGRPQGNRDYLVLETSDYDAESETWEFPPGTVVTCVFETHEGREILVARRLAQG
jgi:hypothetical protein